MREKKRENKLFFCFFCIFFLFKHTEIGKKDRKRTQA